MADAKTSTPNPPAEIVHRRAMMVAVPFLAAASTAKASSSVMQAAGCLIASMGAENVAVSRFGDVEGTAAEHSADEQVHLAFACTERATIQLAQAPADSLHDLVVKSLWLARYCETGMSNAGFVLMEAFKADVIRIAPDLRGMLEEVC